MIISLHTALTTLNPLIALGLFATYIVVDAIYAYYTLAITRQQAMRAATISSLYYFVVAIGVLSYVHNYLYVVPIAAGSWIGTFAVVKLQKRQS